MSFVDRHAATVFYPRRQGVLVTDTWFCAHGRRYAVRDLDDLQWAPGSVQVARGVALKIIALETALVVAIVVASGPSPLAVACGCVNILVMAAGTWLSIRRWPTPLNLCACYRGVSVVIYTSTDHTEFRRIYRALSRAAEQQQLAL